MNQRRFATCVLTCALLLVGSASFACEDCTGTDESTHDRDTDIKGHSDNRVWTLLVPPISGSRYRNCFFKNHAKSKSHSRADTVFMSAKTHDAIQFTNLSDKEAFLITFARSPFKGTRSPLNILVPQGKGKCTPFYYLKDDAWKAKDYRYPFSFKRRAPSRGKLVLPKAPEGTRQVGPVVAADG